MSTNRLNASRAIAIGFVALIGCLVGWHAAAQPAPKTYRIGWLFQPGVSAPAEQSAGDLQQALRDLGYAEGRNLAIEYRSNSGIEGLTGLAIDLVRSRVDVILTSGAPAAVAARRATQTIPIVATELGWDPVKAGLVKSLGRPDGNLTGLASEDMWQKRLAMLKELAPKAGRLAVIWNPANPGNVACIEEIRVAAAGLSMQVRPMEVRDAAAVDSVLAVLATDPPDALAACADSASLAKAGAIANFALTRKLATVAPIREYVQAGSLMSFGASMPTQRRRAAHYIGRILQGARPADLPVELSQPELVINLSTARTLGLAQLPASLMVRADEVIP